MLRLFTATALILTLFHTTVVRAQNLPDYPSFTFNGQISGHTTPSSFSSNAVGVLTASADVFASFNYYALTLATDKTKLVFKYRHVSGWRIVFDIRADKSFQVDSGKQHDCFVCTEQCVVHGLHIVQHRCSAFI